MPDLDADRRPVEAEGEPVLETLISQAEADRIGSRIAFVNAEREADLEETERRLEQLSISPWRTTMMRNHRLLKSMRQPKLVNTSKPRAGKPVKCPERPLVSETYPEYM